MIIVVIVLVSEFKRTLSTAVGFVYKKLFYIAQWSYDLALNYTKRKEWKPDFHL